MSALSSVCALCSTQISTQLTGTRAQQVINTHMTTPGPCFVADQITFTNNGWLIFEPMDREGDQQQYAVICRKLVIDGGKRPGNTTPCNPGDPGSRYGNTNVITWSGRLSVAATGAPITPAAAASGAPGTGGPGASGATGNNGTNGANPVQSRMPASLVVVALEVEVLNKGNLVIDWAGQDGGIGGTGQIGGNGGSGATGTDGSDASWPSSGCGTPTGNGGNGGPGGQGGPGGAGGRGGNAGQITVISTSENLSSSGPFQDTDTFTFVTASLGGAGGDGASGGTGGKGGDPGNKSHECAPGSKGTDGTDFSHTKAAQGASGGPGTSTTTQFVTVTSGACADSFPIPLVFTASPTQTYYRCSAGSGSGTLTLTGQYLDQVASVSTSLSGVTAAIDSSSTDTQLVVDLSIAPNSATGPGDLIFTYNFPSTMTQTLSSAIDVEISQVVSISPTYGTRSSTVAVTLTGTFDPSASSFDVTVSGADVTPGPVTFVNATTLTCNFVIDATAGQTLRDVTLKAGPCKSTLTQSFEVT